MKPPFKTSKKLAPIKLLKKSSLKDSTYNEARENERFLILQVHEVSDTVRLKAQAEHRGADHTRQKDVRASGRA